MREAHRTGEMFAVLFVDLDRFKEHQRFAAAMRSATRYSMP